MADLNPFPAWSLDGLPVTEPEPAEPDLLTMFFTAWLVAEAKVGKAAVNAHRYAQQILAA